MPGGGGGRAGWHNTLLGYGDETLPINLLLMTPYRVRVRVWVSFSAETIKTIHYGYIFKRKKLPSSEFLF